MGRESVEGGSASLSAGVRIRGCFFSLAARKDYGREESKLLGFLFPKGWLWCFDGGNLRDMMRSCCREVAAF